MSLHRKLKLWHIVVIGLGYMAPMAVFDTFGIVTELTQGHVPAAYIFTLIAILLTAHSYGKLVAVFPRSGSAYTYTQQAIGPKVGFLVGWAALLDYLFLPMINALLTNIYISALFPNVPGWIWIVLFVALITFFNIFSVQLTVSFGSFLVLFQVLTAIIFIILSAKQSAGDWTITPLYSPEMSLTLLLSGSAILCFSFLGFDAVTTLAEETIQPEKTIPKGILLVALTGGILFTSVSYFAQLLFPSVASFTDLEGASAEIAYAIGGQLFQSLFVAAALTSTIASGLASHMSASRLLYAMGRDGFLPRRVFGYIQPKTNTPIWNVLIIGAISLFAVFLDLVTATSLINFGALIAFTAVNLSLIVHFWITSKKRGWLNFLNYLFIPVIACSFLVFMWLNLTIHSLLFGLSWSALGFIYLFLLRNSKNLEIPNFKFD